MKKLLAILFSLCILLSSVQSSYAAYDPRTLPNNKFGIHILFTYELPRAAELVNSSGGDWGYVTIPIQYGDRDLEKWQKFMDDAKTHHLIPIIRIATEAFYKNTNVWRKPDDFDVLDFANFLNSLEWPTKNRYVLLFNEINRFDEWGGEAPNPQEYAEFVSYAVDAFKNRSDDFFVIAGGLDNASPNDGNKYLDNLVYLRKMNEANNEVFRKIDGFASHSYPNPNFSQSPSANKIEGTSTYKFEANLIERLSGRRLPIFITETGWNADVLSENTISEYLNFAMNNIWIKDDRIVAVTPFILESNGGPFDKFTFLKNGTFTKYALAYRDIPKVKGDPIVNSSTSIASATLSRVSSPKVSFGFVSASFLPQFSFDSSIIRSYFKAIFGIR